MGDAQVTALHVMNCSPSFRDSLQVNQTCSSFRLSAVVTSPVIQNQSVKLIIPQHILAAYLDT